MRITALLKTACIGFFVALPSASVAQQSTCPPDTLEALHATALSAENGNVTAQAAVDAANAALPRCGQDRLGLSLMMAVLAKTGGALAAPANERDALLFNALQLAWEIARVGGVLRRDDERYGRVSVDWIQQSEQRTYRGLMGDLAADFYTHGRNDLFYRADQQAQFGCGPYPVDELIAYTFAPSFGERGELRARIDYLVANCDDTLRNVSGHAAKYWVEHFNFGAYDSNYAIEIGDIRRELSRNLDLHLSDSMWGTVLFPLEDVEYLRFLLDE